MYDINLNYLGVNPPLPLPGGEFSRTESGGKKEEEIPSIRRKFFGQVSGRSFYSALIRTDIIPLFTNAKK
ncbi:hypothetical protein D5R40_06470 [Okeania hirsuta]|uniref:Uncharacterized protein n=1 Tax=Okeania hirsuta TaxID=1458930 RepID=A0A3N6PF97_9CYAN|nr:hypothetical protein D5R40_06470 [Okeania hirsuta]